MKYVISLLIIFTTFSLPAQDSTSSIKEIPQTESKFRKNEVGVSVNPILMVGLGAYDWPTRWAMTYRRHLNEKLSIRAIAAFNFYQNYNNTLFGSDNAQYNLTDSTSYTLKSYYKKYKGNSFQIGLQYNWGKKKLKWFTGMDMIYMNLQSIKITDSIYEYASSTSTEYYKQSTEIYRSEHREKHIGIFPFIGIRAQFSKHWGFSSHFGYNLTIAKEINNYFSYGISTNESERLITRNLYADAFFQDVSLIFRF